MKKIIMVAVLILCSISIAYAQQNGNPKTSATPVKKTDKESLLIQLKEGAKPKIIVDGKVFDFPMELIDQSKIASVFVVKGKEAIKKYDAPNGVILIKTKGADQLDFSNIDVTQKHKIDNKQHPKVILDGKVVNKSILDTLSSNKIEKVEIVKGKNALKLYNAPNGVIIITTKKM